MAQGEEDLTYEDVVGAESRRGARHAAGWCGGARRWRRGGAITTTSTR
jgi:hypothetical protein